MRGVYKMKIKLKRLIALCPGKLLLLPTAYLLLTVFPGCAMLSERVPQPYSEEGNVVFQFSSPSAKNVCVAGEFNGWEYNSGQQRAMRLSKNEKGVWTGKFKIEPGRYQYKYVIDYQTWILDPANPYTAEDAVGGKNSLLIVK